MNSKNIEFSEKESKKLNNLGLRATYGLTLSKLKKNQSNLAVFTADTSTSAGLDRFRNKYPESFFDCGIAEQCMISTAAGYVEEGGIALASTFAPFLILRAAEQVRLSMGYMNLPLILTGLASGVSLGYLGYTHCCVEDLPLMLNIPNIFVYIPSDCFELSLVLPHIIKLNRPTYIRLTGASKISPLHSSNLNIDFFSPIPLISKGKKLLILSSGAISSNVNSALLNLSISYQARLSFFVLPFIDQEKSPKAFLNLIKNFENVLLFDESMYGGTASFISKIILDNNLSTKYFYSTHPNKYVKCGSYEFMLKQCGLDIQSISQRIKNILEK